MHHAAHDRIPTNPELEYHTVPIDDASERRRDIGWRVARWRPRCGLTRTQFAGFCGRSLSGVDKLRAVSAACSACLCANGVAEALHGSFETLTGTSEVREG